MSKLLVYSNNRLLPFCTVELDNGDRLLVSVGLAPKPRIGVYKNRALGLFYSTLWRFTPEKAGGYKAYIRKFCRAFVDSDNITKPPLDMIRDLVMACRSSAEVIDRFNMAERRMRLLHPCTEAAAVTSTASPTH